MLLIEIGRYFIGTSNFVICGRGACGGRYDFLNIECRIGEIRVLILVLRLHRTDT